MPAPALFLQVQSGTARISDGSWVSGLAPPALCSSLKWRNEKKKKRSKSSAFPSSQEQLFSSEADYEQLNGYIEVSSARFQGVHYEIACTCLLICTLSFLTLQNLALTSLYFSIWACKAQWWTAMETFLTCSFSEEFAYFKARIHDIQAISFILRDIKTLLKFVIICRVFS